MQQKVSLPFFFPLELSFLLVPLMCGSPLDPISFLGRCFCSNWESFDLPVQAFASCSFGLPCLFSRVTFQGSGTFPFALLMYSPSFSENDLVILIMPFTLLFWYVGFPSAALAPSFQNLFVFLVSMPPAGILLFWLPTWVFVVYILYRKHSCMLHRDTPGTLQCKKRMWPSRGGGHRFRCFWSGTGRI